LGTEIFYATSDAADGEDRFGFNVGGFINLTEAHHILFSVGQDFRGNNDLSVYLGYQLTFGPR